MSETVVTTDVMAQGAIPAELTELELLELELLELELAELSTPMVDMLADEGLPQIVREELSHAAGRAYDASNGYNAANTGCRWWEILDSDSVGQASERKRLEERCKWDAKLAKRAREIAAQVMPISEVPHTGTGYASIDDPRYPVAKVARERDITYLDCEDDVQYHLGDYDVVVHTNGTYASCMTAKERLELGYVLARAQSNGIIALED